MRALWLAMLAGCSFLVPPNAWHPAPDLDGEWACPSRAFPITDGVVAGLFVATSIVAIANEQGIQGNDLGAAIGRDIDSGIANASLVSALPWIFAATYGAFRSSSCHDELDRHNTVYFRPR